MSKTQETAFERAKLAKACMAGGTAPYQAARKYGFMRVAIMEEAIRAMEKREKAELDGVKAEDGETAPGPAPAEGGRELRAEQEEAKGKPIYPFLKPGEWEPRKQDTSMMIRTKHFVVKQIPKEEEKPERLRVYGNGKPMPYIDIDRDKLWDMIQALSLYNEMDDDNKEG